MDEQPPDPDSKVSWEHLVIIIHEVEQFLVHQLCKGTSQVKIQQSFQVFTVDFKVEFFPSLNIGLNKIYRPGKRVLDEDKNLLETIEFKIN